MELSKLNNKTILIVEDDPVNSELINEFFEGLETKLLNVASGDEAIEIARKENIDLILMDIQLPGKSGYQATKEIKAFAPNLPIIAQTAYAFESDRLQSLKVGCSDYLAKPFKKEELFEIVLKHLP